MNKYLVLLCCLATLISARPDVSLGYHYNENYDSGGNLLSAPLGGSASTSSGSFSYLSPGYTVSTIGSGGSSEDSYGSSLGGSSNVISESGSSGFSTGFVSGGSGFSTGVNQVYSSSVSTGSNLGLYPTQFEHVAPIITKSFYVHNAPEDHDEQQIVRYITIGRPQKNYRVIFINAPSSSTTKAKIIAQVAPVEEKTAVYVLSKKNNALDLSADVINPPPVAPSKPDVFFIKYKTPGEAVHAQHVIQAQYDRLGGASHFSNEGIVPVQSVIGSLGSAGSSSAFSSTGQAAPTVNVISTGGSVPQSIGGGFVSQYNQVSAGEPSTSYIPPSK